MYFVVSYHQTFTPKDYIQEMLDDPSLSCTAKSHIIEQINDNPEAVCDDDVIETIHSRHRSLKCAYSQLRKGVGDLIRDDSGERYGDYYDYNCWPEHRGKHPVWG